MVGLLIFVFLLDEPCTKLDEFNKAHGCYLMNSEVKRKWDDIDPFCHTLGASMLMDDHIKTFEQIKKLTDMFSIPDGNFTDNKNMVITWR